MGVTLSGALSGGTGKGGLTKIGAGTLTLGGPNSYQGGTVVSAGTLVIKHAAALPAGGALTVHAGATFVFDPSLSGQVVSAASSEGSANLAVGGAAVASVTGLISTKASIAAGPAAPAITKTNPTSVAAALLQALVRSTPNVSVDALAVSAVLAADQTPRLGLGPLQPVAKDRVVLVAPRRHCSLPWPSDVRTIRDGGPWLISWPNNAIRRSETLWRRKSVTCC